MKQLFFAFTILFLAPAFAYAGTIDATDKYARFLSTGALVNFGTTNGGVVVNDANLTGYAWGEGIGWIRLNPTTSGVVNNGYGVLSGYAWGENTGWINFKPTNGGVTIDASGNFSGYAWSELKGWLVFNCATDSSCGTLSHKVKTDWIPISARTACNNTLDDDGDTKIDYPADGGCTSASDTDEAGPYGGGLPTPPPASPPAPVPPPPAPAPSPTPTQPEGTSTPAPGDSQSNNPPQSGTPFVPEAPSDPTPPPPQVISADPPSVTFGGGGGFFSQEVGDMATQATGIISNFFSGTGSVVAEAGTIIRENVKEAVSITKKTVNKGKNEVKIVLDTPVGEATSKTLTTAGVVTVGTTSAFSFFLTQVFSMKDLLLLPAQLWGLLLSAFGIKRRHRPWGTVYDSITKQPLDPAYVELQTLDGKDVATAFTDLDGRYGFFAPPGVYRVMAQKTNYKFPSETLVGKKSDEFYGNLYFGETITMSEGETFLARDIPMDPIGFDWNEYAKRTQHLMGFYSRNTILIERLSRILFFVGFFITLVILFVDPQPYSIVIAVLYVVVWIVRKIGAGDRPHGVVIQKESGQPLAFGAVKVFHPDSNMLVRNSITDALGRYYCLVTKGTYQVEVMRKENDGTYSSAQSAQIVEAPRGIIREKFEV